MSPAGLVRAAADAWPHPFWALQRRACRGGLARRLADSAPLQAIERHLYAERHGWYVAAQGLGLHVPYAVTRRALLRDEFEPLSTARFRAALRPGMRVVDVGASFGLYTLIAARQVGPGGKVHAIEPCRETCDVLAGNVARNRFAQVEVHACAAAARIERRGFMVNRNSTLNGFYPSPLADAGATPERAEVDAAPLDALLDGAVDAIKIDVEGAELEVLDGARRILRASPRVVILVEWNPECLRAAGREPAELPERLRAAGLATLVVLDDVARREVALDEARRRAESRDTPPGWYVNLWAAR